MSKYNYYILKTKSLNDIVDVIELALKQENNREILYEYSIKKKTINRDFIEFIFSSKIKNIDELRELFKNHDLIPLEETFTQENFGEIF